MSDSRQCLHILQARLSDLRRIGLKRRAALADVSQNELRIIVIESSDEEDTSPRCVLCLAESALVNHS